MLNVCSGGGEQHHSRYWRYRALFRCSGCPRCQHTDVQQRGKQSRGKGRGACLCQGDEGRALAGCIQLKVFQS